MEKYTIASFRAAEGVAVGGESERSRGLTDGQLVVVEEELPRPEGGASWMVAFPLSGATPFPARYDELSHVRTVSAPGNPAKAPFVYRLLGEPVVGLGLPGEADWRGRYVCSIQDGLHLVERPPAGGLYIALSAELDFGHGFGRIPVNPKRKTAGEDMEELVS